MSIRALVIADREIPRYRDRWGRIGIGTVWVSYENALQLIQGPASPDFIFDAIIVCSSAHLPEEDLDLNAAVYRDLSIVPKIAALPPSVAMFDGKQWRAIPLIVLTHDNDTIEMPAHPHLTFGIPANEDYGGNLVKESIEDYRYAVLSEYDNLGFIVRHEQGRYVVGPALKSHTEIEGRYYFGPADQRPKGFVTVHRDRFGVQLEIEQFEALINRDDVSEAELQQFFEEHPHFLSHMHTAIPQVRLAKQDGNVLIPDFVLKPIVAQQRDSQWEILDLKLPGVRLLSGNPTSRKRLSSSVMKAIRQLRDYKEHLANPKHAEAIAALLGHPLKRPKLGVLIGRLADTDIEALEREQEYAPDVRIVTYDEILDRQIAQISR